MKITGSDVQLSAQHVVSQQYVRRESLVVETGSQAGTTAQQNQAVPFAEAPGLLERIQALEVAIKAPGVSLLALPGTSGQPGSGFQVLAPRKTAAATPGSGTVEGTASDAFKPGLQDQAKIQMIVAAIESLTGKKIKLLDPGELLKSRTTGAADQAPQAPGGPGTAGNGQAAAGAGAWGLQYRVSELRRDTENTTFAARGTVQTSDGRQIAVSIDLNMSRSTVQAANLDVRMGAAMQDPLAIHFGGPAADLTQTHYAFDLDNNGTQDQIRFVGPGSGFLAQDRNGDGTINNGSELFGPASGDGFSELASYDSDRNGWIDENDPVYSNLRIWSKDAQGNDSLAALGARGVGAIYLGHVATPFEIRGQQDNTLQGAVQSSGLYLNENGTAGGVQHVDLVV